jgi:hypothetical protein
MHVVGYIWSRVRHSQPMAGCVSFETTRPNFLTLCAKFLQLTKALYSKAEG